MVMGETPAMNIRRTPHGCASLQGGEAVAMEAAAVGEGVMGVRAAVNQDRVGEVIVFVAQDIPREVVLVGVFKWLIEASVDAQGGKDALRRHSSETSLHRAPQPPRNWGEAVLLETLLQGFQLVVKRGETEAQHNAAIAVPRGPAPDVRAAKDGFRALACFGCAWRSRHGRVARAAMPGPASTAHGSRYRAASDRGTPRMPTSPHTVAPRPPRWSVRTSYSISRWFAF